MTGILYIVGTPIGNLEDFTLRGLRILKEVSLILCEDTRVTKKLLERYEINTPLLSYHQHSKIEKTSYIAGLLREGKNLALVSDAGTPGISDPGNKLIEELIAQKEDQEIIAIPGPSALSAAASICGFAMDKFLFLGFPPLKKKRAAFFKKIALSEFPVVFYESPYKIIKTLNEIKTANQDALIFVCRELTKKFETVYRGKIAEVIEKVKSGVIKGEFTVVVKNK